MTSVENNWFLKNTTDPLEKTPYILCIISTILLFIYKKPTLLIGYILGVVLNVIVNYIIKYIIKEPRPSTDTEAFHAAIRLNRPIHYSQLGMPSGHVQLATYSTLFIHFALHNPYITFFYTMCTIITVYQRYNSKAHSANQVVVGAIVGALIAIGIYFLTCQYI